MGQALCVLLVSPVRLKGLRLISDHLRPFPPSIWYRSIPLFAVPHWLPEAVLTRQLLPTFCAAKTRRYSDVLQQGPRFRFSFSGGQYHNQPFYNQ